MKNMKIFLIPLAVITLLAATVSCRKEQQPTSSQNIVYNTTVINGVQMKTHYYNVQPDQWLSESNLDYVYASFDNTDITNNVIENGCVICYFVDSDGRDNPMPFNFYRSYVNDSTGDVIYYYSETFSYDVEENNITFKFEASDFLTETSIEQYGDMSFKVCVLDPPTEQYDGR